MARKKQPPVVDKNTSTDDLTPLVIKRGDLKKIADLCREHKIYGKLKKLNIKVTVLSGMDV